MITDDVLLLLAIIVCDSIVFTFFHRKITGLWWWEKPIKLPYAVRLDADGWMISGQGTDPLGTLKTVFDNVTGKNKTMREIINDEIRGSIQDHVRQIIREGVDEMNIKSMINDGVKKELKDMLENDIDRVPKNELP